jgi:amidase
MTAFISEFTLSADPAAQGPTIAIKDSIDVAGYPTTGASRSLADAPPAAAHAEVVQRLLDAGWRITGKTNMHELAFGMTGINDYTGTPVNPQDAARIPGGSSSGSASAVGAKLVDAALGTDTGGSIRGPAACCGVIGLKPTFGRVSRKGAVPRESTLDCVGPFTRDIATMVDAMAAIAPAFDTNAAKRLNASANVAIVSVDADAAIRQGVERAVQVAAFASRAIELDHLKEAFEAGLAVINVETARAFAHLVETGKLGADVDARLRVAVQTTQAQLDAAERARRAFTAAVDRALENTDVLVLPTLPALPITIEAARNGTPVLTMSSLIRPFNLSGHPALTPRTSKRRLLPLEINGVRSGERTHRRNRYSCRTESSS